MKITIAICITIALCSGCASYLMPSSAQMHELAQDTNTVVIHLSTPWGSADFKRNPHE